MNHLQSIACLYAAHPHEGDGWGGGGEMPQSSAFVKQMLLPLLMDILWQSVSVLE